MNVKILKMIIMISAVFVTVIGCGGGEKKPEQEAKVQTKQKSDQANKGGKATSNNAGGKMMTAHYLSEEIEGMEEVKHATVVTQNKNAYVAIEMNREKNVQMNEELKNRMVQRIRTIDPDIKNIYISTSAEFNNEMNGLAGNIERQTPAKEIGESFDELIKKTFPELKK